MEDRIICKICNKTGNGYCAEHSTSGMAYREETMHPTTLQDTEKKKCNKNWHIFNDGDDKPCQCRERKSFNEELDKLLASSNTK